MVFKTGDNNFGVAKWIVDVVPGQGTHTTIASALTSASSGDVIFIRPGVYSENLTLKPGVDIVSFSGEGLTPNVTIVGKLSASFAGSCTISDIRIKTNGAAFLEVSGSSGTSVNLENCFLDCNDATGISFTSSSSSSFINILACNGDIATTGIALYSKSSAGKLIFHYTNIYNSGNSTTASSASAGEVYYIYSKINFPTSTSSTSTVEGHFSHFETSAINTTPLTIAGSGTNIVKLCEINTGSGAGISCGSTVLVYNNNINSSAANAVTGAGTFYNVGNTYGNTPTTNVTTQLPQYLDAGKIIVQNGPYVLAGSGSPNGSITAPQGSLYLRTDGSSTITRAYINTNSGTTWTAITTVA